MNGKLQDILTLQWHIYKVTLYFLRSFCRPHQHIIIIILNKEQEQCSGFYTYFPPCCRWEYDAWIWMHSTHIIFIFGGKGFKKMVVVRLLPNLESYMIIFLMKIVKAASVFNLPGWNGMVEKPYKYLIHMNIHLLLHYSTRLWVSNIYFLRCGQRPLKIWWVVGYTYERWKWWWWKKGLNYSSLCP